MFESLAQLSIITIDMSSILVAINDHNSLSLSLSLSLSPSLPLPHHYPVIRSPVIINMVMMFRVDYCRCRITTRGGGWGESHTHTHYTEVCVCTWESGMDQLQWTFE